jgi:hypothetical protein
MFDLFQIFKPIPNPAVVQRTAPVAAAPKPVAVPSAIAWFAIMFTIIGTIQGAVILNAGVR